MGSLSGKTAIVTGAGSGIGYAVAKAFAREGARLALCGRRIEPLEAVANEISQAGGEAIVKSVDLEDGDAAAAFGHWALGQMGHVDILVNNAGHSTKVRALRYIQPDDFASVFKINVEGVYRLTQSLLDSMVERGSGTVVTVASAAGVNPSLLGGVAYGSAKAAEFAMMRGLSAELRNKGIRACTIIPAEVNTPVLDKRPTPPDQATRDSMMQSEDVADVILMCAAMPGRTLIEQVVMSPTLTRDKSDEIEFAAEFKG